ncbi:MAG: hypothetical protein U9R16_07025 [Campylobacterota bacterium]|nr:hypothetical protein [Campylobacterota bacterium]
MSMSQEEIEALMNGADFEPEEKTEVEETTQEISEEPASEENFDDILAGIDGVTDEPSDEPSSDKEGEDNFDDILAGIDGISEDDSKEGEDNFDDILAGIDGITDEEQKNITESKTETEKDPKLDESKYPLPVEHEHKVVNQLSEVAEDSEEKASQIFDVLSFILDENSEIEKYNKDINSFIEKQTELLESLTNKFPNIAVFSENLELAKESLESSKNLTDKINNENNKVFEAMELMQYHDINRQKIERVMSVIRKLSVYLNGIFEDESDKPEIQIAKHISGDSSDTVAEDDLEALISEFGNEG